MQLSFSKKNKIKIKIRIIEWYIYRDGEMKNNFKNNISSTFKRINHTLFQVTK